MVPRALTLAVTVAGGLSLAACGGEQAPSALLGAIRSDPMASYMPPQAVLTRTREQDQGSALGKAFLVERVREFSVSGNAADAAFDATTRSAKRAGWEFSERPTQTAGAFGETNGVVASRTILRDRAAELVIVVSTPPGAAASTPRKLRISVSSGNQQVAHR